MHPIVERLLARRGKKVPVADGRKVVLVLWGGIMRGVRGGGAMMALSELGLNHAFDAIYTVSVGFPIAAYFLAEQINQGMSMVFSESASRRFINPWRFWKVVDIRFLVWCMRTKVPLEIGKVLGSRTKLYVRAVNLDQNKKFEYLEAHDYDAGEFMNIIEASTSVPVLHPKPVTIAGQRYVDTNINGHLKQHMRHVLATDATDILVIYNAPIQRMLALDDEPRVFEICPPKDWKLSRFEINEQKLRQAAWSMGKLVKESFGEKSGIKLPGV
ncbi:MAG: hypothetical protein HY397_01455 [Candidatus Doudnabacteria bacterium]|nr:hypothetical protein [Candidatus Doudnabacteria bacterium]